MKKVVVFGASGNTGTYFVKYFLENNSDKDYEVVAVGTRETQKFDELGVTHIIGLILPRKRNSINSPKMYMRLLT